MLAPVWKFLTHETVSQYAYSFALLLILHLMALLKSYNQYLDHFAYK